MIVVTNIYSPYDHSWSWTNCCWGIKFENVWITLYARVGQSVATSSTCSNELEHSRDIHRTCRPTAEDGQSTDHGYRIMPSFNIGWWSISRRRNLHIYRVYWIDEKHLARAKQDWHTGCQILIASVFSIFLRSSPVYFWGRWRKLFEN